MFKMCCVVVECKLVSSVKGAEVLGIEHVLTCHGAVLDHVKKMLGNAGVVSS